MTRRLISPAHSFVFALVCAICLGNGNAFADGPALDIGDPHGGSVFSQNTYSLGWKFRVNSPMFISALGFFDDKKDGMAGDHDVGLFDAADCNRLRSVTVKKEDPLIGFFRYRKIDSIALVPEKDYYIAAVTGSDKYLLNPTPTFNVDSTITFRGFAIFGNTQTTTELKCPNGPASSEGIRGDFGPNFIVGTLPDILKDPDNPDNKNDPNKRDTALTLFCNRNGVGLTNADCTVTIADKGPPPRLLPTGVIAFEARDGFAPGSAQCFPTQVEFSPGIGSCKVQFAVPNGFTIGAKFPIDAVYAGDTVFNGSSTSHKLIIPKCIGTPDKPCPNSIGLSFSGYPQLLKNKIAMLGTCGGTSTAQAAAPAAAQVTARGGLFGNIGGACSITGSLGLDAQKLLQALSFPEMQAIGAQIDAATANSDTMLYYLFKANQNLNQQQWEALQINQAGLDKLAQDILKNQNPFKNLIEDPFNTLPFGPTIGRARAPGSGKAAGKKKRKDKSLKSKKFEVEVGPNRTKTIKIQFDARLKKLFTFFEKAGLDSIPLDLTVKVKQKKRRGTATVTETVDVTLSR